MPLLESRPRSTVRSGPQPVSMQLLFAMHANCSCLQAHAFRACCPTVSSRRRLELAMLPQHVQSQLRPFPLQVTPCAVHAATCGCMGACMHSIHSPSDTVCMQCWLVHVHSLSMQVTPCASCPALPRACIPWLRFHADKAHMSRECAVGENPPWWPQDEVHPPHIRESSACQCHAVPTRWCNPPWWPQDELHPPHFRESSACQCHAVPTRGRTLHAPLECQTAYMAICLVDWVGMHDACVPYPLPPSRLSTTE